MVVLFTLALNSCRIFDQKQEAHDCRGMASATPSEEAVEKYCQRIKQLYPNGPEDIPLWPGYAALKDFIEGEHACKKPPGISIVSIPGESRPASEFSITHMIGPWSLLENLTSLSNDIPSSQLIIVENICPNTLTTLGAMYDVDPQFFAEHVNVLTWYNMYEKVPERLPSLPSTKKEEDFLTLRYVSTRELDLSDVGSVYAKSILWPDPRHTRVKHSAGKLEPISRPGRVAPRMVFSRQTVSVWCRKKPNGNGWIGMNMHLGPILSLSNVHSNHAPGLTIPTTRETRDCRWSRVPESQPASKTAREIPR